MHPDFQKYSEEPKITDAQITGLQIPLQHFARTRSVLSDQNTFSERAHTYDRRKYTGTFEETG